MRGNLDGVNNDHLSGWAFDPDDPDAKPEVEVFYNGRLLIRTPAAFPRDDVRKAGVGEGRNGFFATLPALARTEDAEVSARVASTGEALGDPVRLTRNPTCSRTGVLATDVAHLQAFPLHSMQSISLSGQHLTVRGDHLPPGGNPSALHVTAPPGTSVAMDLPFPSPATGDWYWYWPNAGWSGYEIRIDLSASDDDAPAFELTFEIDEAAAGTPTSADYTAFDRHKLWIPKDLGIYQNFPSGDHLTRVQRWDTPQRVAVVGYNDHMRMRRIAEQYGVDLASAHVLDWGCGHGRVLRHFAGADPVAEAWGVDVDAENVGWMTEHLSGVRGAVVPLMPPTDLPAQHFDFVYAISVMTHLTRETQRAWLDEIRRVARPGAIVALTFCGPSGIAFSSRQVTTDYLQRVQSEGFDDSQVNRDLDGKLDDPEYYRNTRQLPEQVRATWSDHLEVLDIFPAVFGFQDVAVMRVPG